MRPYLNYVDRIGFATELAVFANSELLGLSVPFVARVVKKAEVVCLQPGFDCYFEVIACHGVYIVLFNIWAGAYPKAYRVSLTSGYVFRL